MAADRREPRHCKRIAIIALSAIIVSVAAGTGDPLQPLTALARPVDHGPFYFWRGIDMRPITRLVAADASRHSEGMLVKRIQPGSPAAHAGLERGDVITAIDGEPVGTARSLARAIANRCCGSTAALKIRRDHHQLAIELRRH